MANYYEILNITSNATKQEIKKAFKKLALIYHPDRNKGFEEKFKRINEAYQTLSNDTKKRIYDQQLDYELFVNKKSQENTISTHFEKYSFTEPSKAFHYSEQGRHFEEPSKKSVNNNAFYIIGVSIFIIIATASLLFGMFMNNYAAKTHFENANLKYQNEEYVEAIIELNRAIEFKENFSEAYEFRGDLKVKINKLKAALIDYKLAKKHSKEKNNNLNEKIASILERINFSN